MKTKKIVEGRWDCEYCGTKGIRGREKKCPNCGVTRGKNTKFYLPPKEERRILEGEELRTFNRNPDWYCPYCGALNKDDDKTCVNCGSTRTEKNQDYFDLRNEEEAKKKLEAEENNSTEKNKNTTGFFSKETLKSAAKLVGIISIVAFFLYLVSPKWITLKVEEFKWERVVEIEKLQTFEETGDYLPENARLIDTTEESDDDNWWNSSSSYDDDDDDSWWSSSSDDDWSWDSDYESDLGNGYFEIYDMIAIPFNRFKIYIRNFTFNKKKYHYEIDRWVYDRTLTTSGEDHDPYWPDTSNLLENERVSGEKEMYYVGGTDSKGNHHEIKLSYSDWQKIEIDEEVKFEISFGGDVRIIND